jgi:putative glutamine transport system permease protein
MPNSPLILILFFVFFGLPELGIEVNLFWDMTIALIIFEISQLSEIVRGGLNSVDKGQIETARSQGISYVHMLICIILPQSFKNMIPAIVNQFITIVKDTSYTAMFGLMEVLNSATIIWNQDFGYIFPIIFLVAFIYFVINFSLSTLNIKIESKIG